MNLFPPKKDQLHSTCFFIVLLLFSANSVFAQIATVDWESDGFNSNRYNRSIFNDDETEIPFSIVEKSIYISIDGGRNDSDTFEHRRSRSETDHNSKGANGPGVILTTNSSLLIKDAINLTITFDEEVNNFDLSDIAVSNGTASALTSKVAGQTWTATITPKVNGAMIIEIPAGVVKDIAGNVNTASNKLSFNYDGKAPIVSAIKRVDLNPTRLEEVGFDVVFSEDVNNVDVTDFELVITGTIKGASIISVSSNSPDTHIVIVNRGKGEGTFGLNLKDDDSITDDAGNNLGGPGLVNGDFNGEVYKTNNSPTDIILSNNSLDENNSLSDLIGELTTTDEDADDTFTYTLVSGDGDDDNDSFLLVSLGELRAGTAFDFETQSEFSLRVQTDDGKEGTYQEVIKIYINDVNEVASDILLSMQEVPESDDQVVVGVLDTEGDPDANESFTYSIVEGAGAENNLLFQLVNGNELWTQDATNFEATQELSVRIRSTDGGGNSIEKAFTIKVDNVEIEQLRNFDKDELGARIKNFFTPNGDGRNDFWVVKDIRDNPINQVKVYSQTGQLVYSQRNYENNWDGTFEGEPIPPGTYYYEINIYNGESIIRGFLTIIRN